MLDLSQVDLSAVAEALEDNSYDSSWWLDPHTGEVVLWNDSSRAQGEPEPDERGLMFIEPIGSDQAYRDLADFTARVRDPRARGLLERAIEGRGAFRRFKDTLFEFPELRDAWFGFHDTRMERRAIGWLLDQELVDRAEGEGRMTELVDPEPEELSGPFDPVAIAEAVAADLRVVYGDRLRQVILFGSWARGDAHPESDVDLLVVLDRVSSPFEETRRMDEVLWNHSIANGTVVSALAVSEEDVEHPARPVVINVLREGRRVA